MKSAQSLDHPSGRSLSLIKNSLSLINSVVYISLVSALKGKYPNIISYAITPILKISEQQP